MHRHAHPAYVPNIRATIQASNQPMHIETNATTSLNHQIVQTSNSRKHSIDQHNKSSNSHPNNHACKRISQQTSATHALMPCHAFLVYCTDTSLLSLPASGSSRPGCARWAIGNIPLRHEIQAKWHKGVVDQGLMARRMRLIPCAAFLNNSKDRWPEGCALFHALPSVTITTWEVTRMTCMRCMRTWHAHNDACNHKPTNPHPSK